VLRTRALLFHKLLQAIDAASGGLLFVVLLSRPELRLGPLDTAAIPGLIGVALVSALAWPLVFDYLDLYASQRRSSLPRFLLRLTGASAIASALVAGVVFATAAPVVPLFPLALGAAQLGTLALLRSIVYLGLRFARRSGRNYRNVLVVGTGPRAVEAREVLEGHPEWGLRIVGFLDETDAPVAAGIDAAEVHKLVDLPQILREQVVDEVIVACPRSMIPHLEPLVGTCAATGVPITLLSDLWGDYLPAPRVTRFGTHAALNFATVHHSRTQLATKRAIDILLSGVALLFAAPVIAAAAIAIRRSSPGPIFFRQVRCGLYGRPFEMLKLRTMVPDAEARRDEILGLNEMDGPVFKVRNDPRITPVGRILRRWSVDELPQLWNVLMGDMSLVGPRPPIPSEVIQYETSERRRLSMRPGLTCLWQVSGRNEIGFSQWVRLDLEYIDSWSLTQDLKILAKTVPTVLRGTGH
jgi:exopolysaccharide biosynthesis polyprenyl glycosylphosphotransferase